MGLFTLLFRLMVRPMIRQPGRALLIVFAIALGDAAVVSIDLAGDAAAGSFQSSMETLAGGNDLEVTTAGGLPEGILPLLAKLPYALRLSARIEDHATLAATGETVPLVGMDLIGEGNDPSLEKNSELDQPGSLGNINQLDSVWVTHGLASQSGDQIALLINDQTRMYTVRGFIPEKSAGTSSAIVMDMFAAQQATGKVGRMDRILVKTPSPEDNQRWQERVAAVLPSGVSVRPQGAQTGAKRRMLTAFRWNLRILSYIALLVGAFLIYNALSVEVVRRRADIGIMRALGASRRVVLLAFLLESAVFGTVGSLAAIPLGRLMAAGAVRMLSATVNALYVSSRPGPMHISAANVALALIVGIAVSLVSAFSPAREAASVPPVEAMARGRGEYQIRVHQMRSAGIAVLLGAGGVVAGQLPPIAGKPFMGYLAALLFVCASAMLMPLAVSTLNTLGARAMGHVLGAEGLLASRGLAASLRRTSVLVGALSTAIAMMTSVGIMVGSFRETVITWMNSELPADLYLRPAGGNAGDQHPTIRTEVVNRIAAAPGVESVSRFRAYEIEYDGLPVTLASADANSGQSRQSLAFLSGKRTADVMRELGAGNNAIVSEPFVSKHPVHVGQNITLPLAGQRIPFRILDVFYDYGNEAGMIILSRDTMLRYLPDPAPTNLAVYIRPGTSLEAARTAVRKAAANSDLIVLSNGEIRREGIRVFDQTFAITYALEAIAILVAVAGVAGALVAMVIDRRREFGVLRFLGASSGQIRKIILIESAILGLMANAVGLILGYVLSLVLVYVINKQSFGWTIQFHWPVAVLVGSLTAVYLATILAAFIPARMAVRLSPIEVVHEE